MAEFSKQYTQRPDSEFDQWDFDILEIAKDLSSGFYTPIICEGFGFIGIGKDDDGEIILAFPKGNTLESEVEWKSYKEITTQL